MRLSSVRSVLPLVMVGVLYAGCSAPADPTGAPRTCDKDLDCGSHRYCTVARLCRTDCYADADCLGPTTTAQCNAHGRCVETVEPSDAAPPEEDATKTDGGPGIDAGKDDADGGAGGGGP